MNRGNMYKIVLSISIIIFGVLWIQNIKIFQEIIGKSFELDTLNEKIKGKQDLSKKFGYGDIVKAFNGKDSLKILKFSEQKGQNTVTVETEISEDIDNTKRILQHIQEMDNFIKFNNIRLERVDEDKLFTTVNMDFVKNK
jgi:hypothetical protein